MKASEARIEEFPAPDHGIRPCGSMVLLRPADAEEKTAGGIVIARHVAEKEQKAQIKAQLIECGPMAFEEEREIGAPRPQRGDWVCIERYDGRFLMGRDGREYRIVKDSGILAVLSDGSWDVRLPI